MDVFTRVKSIFQSKRLDVEARFELVRETESGSMSRFFMARDRQNDQIVGLKILDPEKTAAFEARFTGITKPGEGEIALAIEHPRIVKTIEHGLTIDGSQYIVMEYLDGHGLNWHILHKSAALDGHRLPLIRQMAEAIGAVHAAGFIHRDISPRNFICSRDLTTLKLIDFGVTVPATAQFMQPGNRTGNPLYMAPEVVRRRATDHRVDVFAFGVSIYQLCTYELPWPVQDASGNAAMLHDSMPPVEILKYHPRLNKTLATAIMTCLAANPAGRPESMEAFLKRVRKVQFDDEQ